MIANENRSELLQSLKEGSFSAFEKLYNLYSGKLYNFIMRLSSGNQYMAEEVVHRVEYGLEHGDIYPPVGSA